MNCIIVLFSGGKEYLLSAHFSLPSVVSEELEGRPPIKVKFEIPYFTTSGIQVRKGSIGFSCLCVSWNFLSVVTMIVFQ